jgi:hypothetical protein
VKALLLLIPLVAGLIYVARDRASRAVPQSDVDVATVTTTKDPHADCVDERDALLARIERLEARLAEAQADALQREEDWVEYNRMIVSIAPEDLFPELHAAKVEEALADRAPEPPNPALVALQERSRKIHVSLSALFRAEGIDAFDLLEVGTLGDGSIGPVLLRSFDDRGRAIGTLTAARLRLEGSRSGRTLTLVLEDGYSRRAGVRTPFPGAEEGQERGGVMRVVIPHTDPDAWSSSVPELFREDLSQEIVDDGRWNHFVLRRELNARLDRGGLGGRYVLKDLAGVRDGVLRDVALDELDESGALRRRLFADRLALRIDTAGVQLVLEDGVVVRGDQKLPFLDGRMRVFLPSADVDEWTDGTLPVIDAREAAVESAPADSTEDPAAEVEPAPEAADESTPEPTDSALPR